MSEDKLTREEIVAAWNEAVPESKDKGIEMYLYLMQAVADAQYRKCALAARSEGFREGVEAAARVCKKAADDLYEFAEEQRKVGQARVAADNESKAATAKVLENHIRALSPRETDVSGDRQ